MRSSFAVEVVVGGKTVPTADVDIQSDEGKNDLYGVKAAADGKIHINDLRPGHYSMLIHILGVFAADQCFHVGEKSSIGSKSEFDYQWRTAIPEFAHASGSFTQAETGRLDSVPVRGAQMAVQDPFRNTTSRAETNAGGNFDFGSMPDGYYVLHVVGIADPNVVGQDLLIRINHTAKITSIMLWNSGYGPGNCGQTILINRSASH